MENRSSHRNGPAALALAIILAGASVTHAEGDPATYQNAVPALEQAGGGKACVECFLTNYGPSPFNKAFAVSLDGAYGARWERHASLEKVREAALESCRKKPAYNAAHPCVIFFENDRQIWKP